MKNPNSPTSIVTPEIHPIHMIMARTVMVHAMNRLFKRQVNEEDLEGLPEYAKIEMGEGETAVLFYFKLIRDQLNAIISIRLELDETGEPIFEFKINADWAEKNLKRVQPGDLKIPADQKGGSN